MRVFVFGGVGPDGLRRALAIGGIVGADILAEASDTLAEDLRARLLEPDGSCRDAQLSAFLAGHIQLEALRRVGDDARWSLGRSLGEYNHLVHIGALAFADAVRLVDARGRAFDRGPDGATLSVVGVARSTLRRVLAEIAGFAEISRFDDPTRHVIAGDRASVRIAKLKLEHVHLARCVVLPERRPAHCDLFEPVADAFEPALWNATWHTPRAPYFPNVRGEPVADAGFLDFVVALRAQLHRPVLWAQSLQWIARELPSAELVHIGVRARDSDRASRPALAAP